MKALAAAATVTGGPLDIAVAVGIVALLLLIPLSLLDAWQAWRDLRDEKDLDGAWVDPHELANRWRRIP